MVHVKSWMNKTAVFVSLFMLWGAGMNGVKATESWQGDMWPVEGEITDTFGSRGGDHHGTDIAAEVGEAVRAIEDGKVTRSYYSGTYGHVIFIRHHNGWESVYAHLDERFVDKNVEVKKGEKVGTVGNTGRSSGPHLHFELHEGEWNPKKTNAVNPEQKLKKQQLETNDRQDNQTGQLKNDHSAEIPSLHSRSHDIAESDAVAGHAYVIKKGDTLSEIAKEYDVSVKMLQELNDIEGELIIAGEVLKIPLNVAPSLSVRRNMIK